MSNIALALALANTVHGSQVDKVGKPYMGHILRVWISAAQKGANETIELVSILHDTLEDDKTGALNPTIIAKLFGWEVATSVNLLTRSKDEDYLLTYIPRVKTDHVATMVKLLDLEDHLNRLDNSEEIDPKRRKKMRDRYVAAQKLLLED